MMFRSWMSGVFPMVSRIVSVDMMWEEVKMAFVLILLAVG